jgi:hypothetical protein
MSTNHPSTFFSTAAKNRKNKIKSFEGFELDIENILLVKNTPTKPKKKIRKFKMNGEN